MELKRKIVFVFFGFSLIAVSLMLSSCRQSTAPNPSQLPTTSEIIHTVIPSPAPSPTIPTPTQLPTPTATSIPKTETLVEAILFNSVEAEFHVLEPFFGNTVLLTIRNNSDHSTNISIEQGEILVSSDPNEMSFVLNHLVIDENLETNSEIIVLNDDSWHEFKIDAYSLNCYLDEAKPGHNYTVISPIPSEVQNILNATSQDPGLLPDSIQGAIWAITDGIDQEDAARFNLQIDIDQIYDLFELAGIELDTKRISRFSTLSNAESYLTSANKFLEIGEFAQAIADFTDALNLVFQEGGVETRLYPGQIHSAEDRATVFANPSLKSLAMELYYRRGMAFLQKQDFAFAIQDFQVITQEDSQNPYGHFALGLAYSLSPNPNFYEALAELNTAIGASIAFTDALIARGKVYSALGDPDLAIKDYTDAIEMERENIDAYYARGQVFQQQGNFERALKDFSKVISYDRDYAEAYRERGFSYAGLGMNSEAVNELEKYLKRAPSANDSQQITEAILNLQGVLPTPSPNQRISLLDASYQNWINMTFHSLGSTSGDNILVRIERTINQEITLYVPPGIILLNDLIDESDMIVRRLRGEAISDQEILPTDLIVLNQSDVQEYILETYSMDYFKTEPSDESTFTLGGIAEPEIINLLRTADLLPDSAILVLNIQAALWGLLDDVQLNDLESVELEPELEVVKLLLESAGANLECTALFGSGDCPVLTDSP